MSSSQGTTLYSALYSRIPFLNTSSSPTAATARTPVRTMPNLRQGLLLGVAFLVAIVFMVQRQQTLTSLRARTVWEEWKDPVLKNWFSFVPANIKWCEVLFEPSGEKIYPPLYHKYKPDFNHAFWQARDLFTIPEGHSGDGVEEEYLSLSHLANLSFVKTICETGFNGGHSTFNYLTSNPKAHVYSFDLGSHEYSRPMASFLQKTFNGRLNVTWGDSTLTIPEFKKKNPKVICDLIIVDGGHMYPVAKGDLRNLRTMANKDKHLLVLDDHPRDKSDDVKKVWLEELRAAQVKEYWKCQFFYTRVKGFTVGKYIGL